MIKLFSFLIMLALLSLPCAHAGELYSCIDRDGNSIVTDSPQDGMKNCVLKDSYEDDPTPTKTKKNKLRSDYSNKIDEIERDHDRTVQELREASEAREKAYNKGRCVEAKNKETYYRYQWRNAKTDEDTLFWKRMMDSIEEICSKAK